VIAITTAVIVIVISIIGVYSTNKMSMQDLNFSF
jgi:hypothetical protein